MEIQFVDQSLDDLEVDASYDAGLPAAVVKMYRKRIFFLRGASDERDLYQMKSLHFEKLKGKRQGQHSIRLNDQWRLVLEIQNSGSQKIIKIISVEDYH